MTKIKYRTFGEVEEEYLHNHPEEIDDYITLLFDEYAETGDANTLFASLQLNVLGFEAQPNLQN